MSSDTNSSASTATGLLQQLPPDTESFASEQNDIKEEKAAVVSKGSEAKPAAVQACVVPHDGKPVKTAAPAKNLCKFSSLTLTLPKQAALSLPGHGPDVIKLVAGYNKNAVDVSCKIVGGVGPCTKHKSHIFDTQFGKDKATTATDTDLKFKAKSVPFYKLFHNGTLIPWHAQTASYKINANTCGTSVSKEIIVYPDIELKIDVPLKFEEKTEREGVGYSRSGKSAYLETTPAKELEIEASYTEDGQGYTMSPQFKKKFDSFKELVLITKKTERMISEAFDKTCVLEVKGPSGNIHADFTYKKDKDYSVDTEWSVLVQVKPLVSAAWTVQLDEAALKMCTGPVGTVYSKIKSKLDDIGCKIHFEFIATGSLDVDLGLKKEAGKKEAGTGAGLSGKVEFELKARASFDVKLIFHIEAEAKAGVKAALMPTMFIHHEGEGVEINTKLEFSGVVFYYSVSVAGQEKSKVNKGMGMGGEKVVWKPEGPICEHTFTF